jgi:hypothetical protein
MRTHTKADGLADLLDKLIAVDLELEPFGRTIGGAYPAPAEATASIRQTCDVLRSSIADLRRIILETEGMPYLAHVKPARRKHA